MYMNFYYKNISDVFKIIMKLLCVILLASTILLLATPNSFAHRFDCPEYVKPDNPKVLYSFKGEKEPPGIGFPLNKPVLKGSYNDDKSDYWIYQVPIGYLKGWLHKPKDKRDVNSVFSRKLHFWMPEMRYPERKMSDFYLPLRICEHGRPAPSKNQYLVHMYITRLRIH